MDLRSDGVPHFVADSFSKHVDDVSSCWDRESVSCQVLSVVLETLDGIASLVGRPVRLLVYPYPGCIRDNFGLEIE